MRCDVIARLAAVGGVVRPDDHVDAALAWGDVDRDDGDVLALRIVEGRPDRGAVSRVDDQRLDALRDQRFDVDDLLRRLVSIRLDVGYLRAAELHAQLRLAMALALEVV